jgi:probable phosphomutase (TIGR03848 family)
MPIIYLLRHAQSVANTKGILAGQDNSVELSKDGHKQAQLLAPYLSTIKMNRVYSSPLTRCIQTISPFMQLNPNLDFEIDESFIEMDYGVWSGKRLSSLARDKRWKSVQNKPSTFTFPQGESFRSMRKRVDLALIRLSKEKGNVLIVTHGDIIKMSLASALGLPIDRFQRFVAEPASLTVINYEKTGSTVLQTNFKVSAEVARKFKQNQLGGGNSLSNSTRWWRR